MTERHQRGLIGFLQPAENGAARAPQVVEPLARDAVAHVEAENHVERNLLEADEIDLLRHAVVEDLEVGGFQAGDRLAFVGDEDVDAHRFYFRRERRLLRRQR